VRLSTRKFEYQNADAIYLTCVVRRCVRVPCGVCAERRLGEVGAGLGEEIATVVTLVRLQNDKVSKASTKETILIVSGAVFIEVSNPSMKLADDRIRVAFEESVAEKIALETNHDGISKEVVSVSLSSENSIRQAHLRGVSTGVIVEYKISVLPDVDPIGQNRTAVAVAKKMSTKNEKDLLLIFNAALHDTAVDVPTLKHGSIVSAIVRRSASVQAHHGHGNKSLVHTETSSPS